MKNCWIALNIGNSRLHWALFQKNDLQLVWDSPHLTENTVKKLIDNQFDFAAIGISLPNQSGDVDRPTPELWIASVVEEQALFWRNYAKSQWIDLAQIPLHQVYSTLGVDRALSLWGAIQTYGTPALVIDCGTAMTFTGADRDLNLIGGAIAPGLRLQFEVLGQKTSALPKLEASQLITLPPIWARTTIEAIQSGILQMVLAGIRAFVEDWTKQFPNSTIVLTGGDAPHIYDALEHNYPDISDCIQLDLNVAFWGMQSIRNSATQRKS
jgi:type III pantothenate kinase